MVGVGDACQDVADELFEIFSLHREEEGSVVERVVLEVDEIGVGAGLCVTRDCRGLRCQDRGLIGKDG